MAWHLMALLLHGIAWHGIASAWHCIALVGHLLACQQPLPPPPPPPPPRLLTLALSCRLIPCCCCCCCCLILRRGHDLTHLCPAPWHPDRSFSCAAPRARRYCRRGTPTTRGSATASSPTGTRWRSASTRLSWQKNSELLATARTRLESGTLGA